MQTIETTSRLKCPHCHEESVVTMPTDSCQFFFQCPACEALIRPKPGDCCVFCSYGSVPCPPIQREQLAIGSHES